MKILNSKSLNKNLFGFCISLVLFLSIFFANNLVSYAQEEPAKTEAEAQTSEATSNNKAEEKPKSLSEPTGGVLGGDEKSTDAKADDKALSNLENILYLDLKEGRVVIELLPDLAPNHVARIKELTRDGFYNNAPFHRVMEGFMAQTGDPTGTGRGGSGKTIKAEFSAEKHIRGTVSMARSSDPDSADSQFFICFDEAAHLDGQYTIFGKVIKGIEFVDKIKKGDGPNGKVTDPDKIVKMQVAADTSEAYSAPNIELNGTTTKPNNANAGTEPVTNAVIAPATPATDATAPVESQTQDKTEEVKPESSTPENSTSGNKAPEISAPQNSSTTEPAKEQIIEQIKEPVKTEEKPASEAKPEATTAPATNTPVNDSNNEASGSDSKAAEQKKSTEKKAEAKKPEAAKAKPKTEPKKVEAPKVEAPKVEAPIVETPKASEAPKKAKTKDAIE